MQKFCIIEGIMQSIINVSDGYMGIPNLLLVNFFVSDMKLTSDLGVLLVHSHAEKKFLCCQLLSQKITDSFILCF